MISFKEFLDEMARTSGENDKNNHSREYDWNKFYKDTSNVELLLKNIGSQHLKLYRVPNTYQFFLTDENDNYKGQLSLTVTNKVAKISTSNSKLNSGFYNIMFTSIFGTGLVKEILSDIDLSLQAIGSYEKLKNNTRLNVQIFDGTNYYPFSKEVLLHKDHYRASVKEISNNEIKEHFDKYYDRISKTIILEDGTVLPDDWGTEFNRYGSGMDSVLFGEYWNWEENYI